MTTTNYSSEVKMLNAGFMVLPAAKLSVTVSGNYSISDAQFDPVMMPEVSVEVEDNLHTDGYDYSMINTYSDMSYKRLDASCELNYMLATNINWSAEAAYIDFTDDTGYVFGDETGSLYIIRTAFEYGF